MTLSLSFLNLSLQRIHNPGYVNCRGEKTLLLYILISWIRFPIIVLSKPVLSEKQQHLASEAFLQTFFRETKGKEEINWSLLKEKRA